MLTHDLRDAARNLRRNRGFSASAIAILNIGIAASTGLFAVVDAVVLHPLPYVGADRLARVQLLPPSGPVRSAPVTADEFRALRQHQRSMVPTSATASLRNDLERFRTAR